MNEKTLTEVEENQNQNYSSTHYTSENTAQNTTNEDKLISYEAFNTTQRVTTERSRKQDKLTSLNSFLKSAGL